MSLCAESTLRRAGSKNERFLFCSVNRTIAGYCTQDMTGIANRNHVVRDVMCDNTSGADYGVFTDMYSRTG